MVVSEEYIHEKRKKLLCLCVVAEMILHTLLRYCLDPANTGADTDKLLADTFRQVKSNVLNKISSLHYPCNSSKVYVDVKKKTVHNVINIEELDLPFTTDILMNIGVVTGSNVSDPHVFSHVTVLKKELRNTTMHLTSSIHFQAKDNCHALVRRLC